MRFIITAKVAGAIAFRGEGFEGFVFQYNKLATDARNRALSARTIKDQRFSEGQAMAFEQVAKLFSTMTVEVLE